MAARPLVFLIGPAAEGCKVTEDADLVTVATGDPPAVPTSVEPRSKTQGGCGCHLPRVGRKKPAAAGGMLLLLLIVWRTARRRRSKKD
jgi:hypothetical protein